MWKLMTAEEKIQALEQLKKLNRVRKTIKRKIPGELIRQFFLLELGIPWIPPFENCGVMGAYRPIRKVFRRTQQKKLEEFIIVDVFLVELKDNETVVYETTPLLKSVVDGSFIKDPLYYG